MKKQELLTNLQLEDAFQGFVPNPQSELWGWHGDLPIFEELIRELRPELIIEVGTWLGQSTSTMAQALKKHGLMNSCIVAVDTWLGSLEQWKTKEFRQSLGFQNGFPTLYPRFLSNMLNAGSADMIIPLPLPSLIAARYLQEQHLEADLIYIDGSHDEKDVYEDIVAYWPLLKRSGCVFGDDWSWPSVVAAVKRFCSEEGLSYEFSEINWRIRKN